MVTQLPPAATATAAAGRLSRASVAIGALGLLTALFMLDRLAETWQVGARAAGHTITIVGVRLAYPAANVSAIAILLLAALGFAMTLRAILAAAREGLRSRRLVHGLGSEAT